MNIKRIIIVTVLCLATSATAFAQDYNLGWEQIDKAPPKTNQAYTLDWQAVDQNVSRETVASPKSAVAVTPSRPLLRRFQRRAPQAHQPPAPTYKVALTSNQIYDHYAQKYHVVDYVEVAANKGGGLFYETFENTGRYSSYDVYLNDLKEGETYTVKVVWNDGSNRTIEKTANSQLESRIFIDEPDALAYGAYW